MFYVQDVFKDEEINAHLRMLGEHAGIQAPLTIDIRGCGYHTECSREFITLPIDKAHNIHEDMEKAMLS